MRLLRKVTVNIIYILRREELFNKIILKLESYRLFFLTRRNFRQEIMSPEILYIFFHSGSLIVTCGYYIYGAVPYDLSLRSHLMSDGSFGRAFLSLECPMSEVSTESYLKGEECAFLIVDATLSSYRIFVSKTVWRDHNTKQ
jgi:hypothetical protein